MGLQGLGKRGIFFRQRRWCHKALNRLGCRVCASPRADPFAGTRGLGGSIWSFFLFSSLSGCFGQVRRMARTATSHVTTIVRRRSKNKAEGCGASIFQIIHRLRNLLSRRFVCARDVNLGGTRLYSKNPSPFQCALRRETQGASFALLLDPAGPGGAGSHAL